MSKLNKSQARIKRQRRVRSTVKGVESRPRLSVFRSALHIYAQLIDDEAGKTLAAASDADLKKTKIEVEGRNAKVAAAFALGKLVAERAIAKGITTVVFDRNGFAYTGRIASLADGAREGGLKF